MTVDEGEGRVDHDPDGDRARLSILVTAARDFAEATQEPERLLCTVAKRLAEVVKDQCVVRLISDDGRALVSVAVYGTGGDSDVVLREVNADPLILDEHPILRAIHETGEPFISAKFDPEAVRARISPSFYEWARRIGMHSALTLPLRSRGSSFGHIVLTRYRRESPSFGEDDLSLARAIADHAAIAIANSRSYAAERTARDAAERATVRFARLRDAGVIGILVARLDGQVVEINDTLLGLLGYPREDILSGRVPWFGLTPPEWRHVDVQAVEQLRATGIGPLREKELVRHDGKRTPVLVGSAMLNPETTECISFVLDLSDRKEAERARGNAERKAERMIESAMVGIWLRDAHHKTSFVNARMASILGVARSEAIGKPVSAFLFDEDHPALAKRLAEREAGLSGSLEQRIRRADGATRDIAIESSPMYDEHGRFEGVLGVVADITDRRRTEQSLRESEQRYRLMFDESPLPKWVYDAQTLRFIDVNATAVQEYGYSREEFMAMTVRDVRAPDATVGLAEAEGAGPAPKFHVLRLRKKSGEVITVEVTSHAVTIGDQACRLAVGRDVTERIRLEEQLRQAQKMEAVGRLAGGVAHDFNNILSVILGYGEMLIADLKPGEPMRDDIDEIRKAGLRAADLTRQLLMFSRQKVVEPRVLDLNDLLAGIDKMLRRIVGADVDIVSLPTSPLGRVRVDPGSMEQVVMNLVVNARDAMPTGGKLTLETDNVVLDEAYAQAHHGVRAGPHVMLAVTDTGSGIDKETLPRIFEPFFTTKEKGKGTGLGLATVFGIVHQSGGSVWVYSELGKGTSFKVYLPRVDADLDAPGAALSPASRRGSETILLVEDDEAVRIVVRGILRRSGYHVIEAQSAGDALLHVERHPATIHLLLTDVVMPQMSGPELARRLARVRPSMKVLCMSGYTDDSIVRHGVVESQTMFLQKPITPDALTLKVREVLDAREERPG